MVDFRPLLFINALALMLLVTAGFASMRDEQAASDLPAPSDQIARVQPAPEPEHKADATSSAARTQTVAPEQPDQVAEQPARPAPEPEPAPAPDKPIAEPFSIPDAGADNQTLAVAEQADTLLPDATEDPAPTEPEPTTGLLVLRSNVYGDQVTINGKDYGTTRLDLELEPGTYDVAIAKPGYRPWEQTVTLSAGDETTLVGELEKYTRVNYQNGSWIGGVKTGDGRYQGNDGLHYEGHFVDGKFEGKGVAEYPDGSRYDGDWVKGQWQGEGVWHGADGSEYTGEFVAGQFDGKGTLTRANGDILTGHWQGGELNGQGSLTTADGMLYVGGFRNNRFHGQGTLTYPNGRHYEGEFSDGAYNGTGTEIFADGKKYEGQFIEGKFHGKGTLSNPNGSSIEATFKNGEPYGQVRLTTAAGEIFTARTTEPGVCYRDKSYRATQCPKLEGW
ncbi:MAG: PEGA domain-containing protein [Marinobacter sp.]|nr:PEGA domain-containing protein [Marinobacter sp.]